MAGVGTKVWSNRFAGTSMAKVRKASRAIGKVVDRTKDVNRDGRISDWELKRTLRGSDRETWSAVMGTFASTVGNVHNDPSRAELKGTLKDTLTLFENINTTKTRTLEFDELRQLKTRMPGRLLEYTRGLK